MAPNIVYVSVTPADRFAIETGRAGLLREPTTPSVLTRET
jgi:hypothetical protein